jgi:hypothetical protein
MRRTESARKMSPVPNASRARRTIPTGAGHSVSIAAIVLALTLGGATLCAGASGPGIGIKVGAQTFDDPVDLDRTTRARLELEVASGLLWDEHVDFALAFGGSFLGTYRDTYTDFVDGIYIDDLYTDRLWLFDIRLAARLYPLGDSSRIRPYVGGGVGYFWFHDRWENDYSDTFEEPPGSGSFLTITDHTKGTANLAEGFFPFLLAGITFPVGSNVELLAEFQYDFDKRDKGFDFSGPIYSFGARFRF